MRDQVISRIREGRIIAILRGVPGDSLLSIADALIEGGVRLIECTFDHGREDCLEANAAMIGALIRHTGSEAFIGCGTALTAADVDAACDAGAAFVISPHAGADVIRRTLERGAVSIPGAMTPTEIVSAYAAGADFIKIFPAGNLGHDYVKAVRAPLKHIPMLAVGGITPENMPAFLKAGICGFGIGSPLLPKADIESKNWAAVTERARLYVSAAAEPV